MGRGVIYCNSVHVYLLCWFSGLFLGEGQGVIVSNHGFEEQ